MAAGAGWVILQRDLTGTITVPDSDRRVVATLVRDARGGEVLGARLAEDEDRSLLQSLQLASGRPDLPVQELPRHLACRPALADRLRRHLRVFGLEGSVVVVEVAVDDEAGRAGGDVAGAEPAQGEVTLHDGRRGRYAVTPAAPAAPAEVEVVAGELVADLARLPDPDAVAGLFACVLREPAGASGRRR